MSRQEAEAKFGRQVLAMLADSEREWSSDSYDELVFLAESLDLATTESTDEDR